MTKEIVGRNLVIAIYSHPEYYPPTLSAIENLAGIFDQIELVHGNIGAFDWKYPDNVRLNGPEKLYPAGTVEGHPLFRKIKSFADFTSRFRAAVKKTQPETVLFYDYMPILSWRLFHKLVSNPNTIWYHNHDVADSQYMRKYSLSWFAWKSEQWIFPKLTIFSLPAMERRAHFPMQRLKGRFFFLPNFPSKYIYKRLETKTIDPGTTIRLLYQGSIGPLHGLEEIIPLLKERVSGYPLELVLKGFVKAPYLSELRRMANSGQVDDRLVFLESNGYLNVIKNAVRCHIGIGIYRKQDDIMNRTVGTASNKIYEYAASGLPVLIYDSVYFRELLGKYPWVFFTDASEGSLREATTNIIDQWPELSAAARKDFEETLCFEIYFKPLLTFLEKKK